MSGIAIVLENADFLQKNIGKVNFITDVPVEGISITGTPETGDPEVTLGISYTPIGTSQRGVDWAVTSGAATINQSGVLVPNAFVDTNVVVSAVSKFNPNVYATKSIAFSYENLAPTWSIGLYDTYGYKSSDGGGRYYTIVGGISLTSDYSIVCEEGFCFRLRFWNGTIDHNHYISSTDLLSSCRVSEVAPENATIMTINVSHEGATPTSGTIFTEEEVARLNEIFPITELNK